MHATLVQLHEKINHRAASIIATTGEWPCHKGCDHCCRHLAAIPEATRAEWEQVSLGINALPPETHQKILTRIQALPAQLAAPYTCPFLDEASQACLIYTHRPVACRTYGFYVERDQGLYCTDIRQRVERGDYPGVVWGNQASIAAQLAPLGPAIPLTDWFAAQR